LYALFSCVLVVLVSPTVSRSAGTPSHDGRSSRCEAAIDRAAGTFSDCLLKARAKNARKEDEERLFLKQLRCEKKFTAQATRALNRFGEDQCTSNVQEIAIRTLLHAELVADEAQASSSSCKPEGMGPDEPQTRVQEVCWYPCKEAEPGENGWNPDPASPYNAMCSNALKRASLGQCGPHRKESWMLSSVSGLAADLSETQDLYKEPDSASLNSAIEEIYKPHYWGDDNASTAKAIGVGFQWGHYLGLYNCKSENEQEMTLGVCRERQGLFGIAGSLYPMFVGTQMRAELENEYIRCPWGAFPGSRCQFKIYKPESRPQSGVPDSFALAPLSTATFMLNPRARFSICERGWFQYGTTQDVEEGPYPLNVYQNFKTAEPVYGYIQPWSTDGGSVEPCLSSSGSGSGVALALEYVVDAAAFTDDEGLYDDCVEDCCTGPAEKACSDHNFSTDGDRCEAAGCRWECGMPVSPKDILEATHS